MREDEDLIGRSDSSICWKQVFALCQDLEAGTNVSGIYGDVITSLSALVSSLTKQPAQWAPASLVAAARVSLTVQASKVDITDLKEVTLHTYMETFLAITEHLQQIMVEKLQLMDQVSAEGTELLRRINIAENGLGADLDANLVAPAADAVHTPIIEDSLYNDTLGSNLLYFPDCDIEGALDFNMGLMMDALDAMEGGEEEDMDDLFIKVDDPPADGGVGNFFPSLDDLYPLEASPSNTQMLRIKDEGDENLEKEDSDLDSSGDFDPPLCPRFRVVPGDRPEREYDSSKPKACIENEIITPEMQAKKTVRLQDILLTRLTSLTDNNNNVDEMVQKRIRRRTYEGAAAVEGKGVVTCPFGCGKTTRIPAALGGHAMRCPEANGRVLAFRCEQCDRCFRRSRDILRHLKWGGRFNRCLNFPFGVIALSKEEAEKKIPPSRRTRDYVPKHDYTLQLDGAAVKYLEQLKEKLCVCMYPECNGRKSATVTAAYVHISLHHRGEDLRPTFECSKCGWVHATQATALGHAAKNCMGADILCTLVPRQTLTNFQRMQKMRRAEDAEREREEDLE